MGRSFILCFAVFLFCGPVLADCTSPAAKPGTMDYSGAPENVFKYCDGSKWKSMSLPVCAAGQGLVMGAETWECCPVTGGEVWETVNIGEPYKVTYGNGMYMARGYGSTFLWRSTDGINWTDISSVTLTMGYALTYANGLFFVPSDSNKMLSSPDGINWTERGSIPQRMAHLTHGNGAIVGISGINGYPGASTTRSLDGGMTWENGGFLPYTAIWRGFAYGNGIFMAVGNVVSPSQRVAVISSDNGATWNSVTPPLAIWDKVAFGNGVFIVMGTSNDIAISADGLNWTPQTLPSAPSGWGGLAFSGGLFIASNRYGIATSKNGIEWDTRNVSGIGLFPYIYAANGTFFLVGDTGRLLVSRATSCP